MAPPPVSEAVQHGVYPDMRHDERARFNFHACLYKAISSEVSPGNPVIYEKRVLPGFQKKHGREPNSRHEVRRAMTRDPFHNFWGALRRNTMEMRQVNGQFVTLRQLDELAARAEAINKGADRLILDPDLDVPYYVSEVDHHCMPGSYYRELVEGDVAPAANYDAGFFVTTGGTIGGLCDGGGRAVVQWLKDVHPDFRPKRILDIGTALGNSLVPIAAAFSDAEVIALDVSAPMLRYGHARATSLGVENITFMQKNGEDLSEFEDGSFDLVMTSIFLHELSSKSLPKVIQEAYRVLAKGGLMLHLEQPQYTDDMPLYEQYMRDWDSYNNNEPFWSAMHEIDLIDLLASVGFDAAAVNVASLRGVTDYEDGAGPTSVEHGRAPDWHAYVARK
jgi:SAM-dependent methyltransferase